MTIFHRDIRYYPGTEASARASQRSWYSTPVTHSLRATQKQSDPFTQYAIAFKALGWDGEDALPITPATIAAARAFYSFLTPYLRRSLAEPDIAPGVDGTIGLEWDFTNDEYCKLFVEVQPFGAIRWFRVRGKDHTVEHSPPQTSMARAAYRLEPMLERLAKRSE